jgi:hypothetical protein
LAGRALFGEDLIRGPSDIEGVLEEDFGPKVKEVVLADGTITHGTCEVFEKPCPPANTVALEHALGRRTRRDIQSATIDRWLEEVVGLDVSKKSAMVSREWLKDLLRNPYSKAHETRLLRIIHDELPRFQALPSRPKKRDGYRDELQKKHRLSGADAEAVTKVIWDNDGKVGRPPSDPHN